MSGKEEKQKICCRCLVVKPYIAFHRRQYASDGHAGHCKQCDSNARRANYQKKRQIHYEVKSPMPDPSLKLPRISSFFSPVAVQPKKKTGLLQLVAHLLRLPFIGGICLSYLAGDELIQDVLYGKKAGDPMPLEIHPSNLGRRASRHHAWNGANLAAKCLDEMDHAIYVFFEHVHICFFRGGTANLIPEALAIAWNKKPSDAVAQASYCDSNGFIMERDCTCGHYRIEERAPEYGCARNILDKLFAGLKFFRLHMSNRYSPQDLATNPRYMLTTADSHMPVPVALNLSHNFARRSLYGNRVWRRMDGQVYLVNSEHPLYYLCSEASTDEYSTDDGDYSDASALTPDEEMADATWEDEVRGMLSEEGVLSEEEAN